MEWWQEFFSGLWLEVQTKGGEKRREQDADFIEKLVSPSLGLKILDVPCGDGRISLELTRRGYNLIGVDNNKALLSIAQQISSEEGLELVWEGRDMRDLPWTAEFDMAICWGGSFGYFDDPGNAKFLKGVYEALKPGGVFLLETLLAETLLPVFVNRDWERVADGEILMLQDRRYNHITGRIECEWTLIKGDRAETKNSSIRVYTYRELIEMLRVSGFTDLRSYGSKDLDEFRFGSRRLYMVASKPPS